MRFHFPRAVPWSLVSSTWEALGSGLKYRSANPCGLSMAYVRPLKKVLDMIRCLDGEDWKPDMLCAGELWVRWGCDGVPLWGRNYVTLTASLGALGARQPLQLAWLIALPYSDP